MGSNVECCKQTRGAFRQSADYERCEQNFMHYRQGDKYVANGSFVSNAYNHEGIEC